LLNIYGERWFPVPPLDVPDPEQPPILEEVQKYAAIRLFVERAVAIQPRFTLTPANAPTIVAICERLEGLPLAIELAAVRIRHLSPKVILDRLYQRLALLTGGARDLPERQQTLRAALDWSYDLLAPGVQRLFRHLAPFVGGGALDAIAAVNNIDNAAPLDLVDQLALLVDQSLIYHEDIGDESRFSMLDTVREYAEERLVADAEAEAAYAAHATYYLGCIRGAAPGASDEAHWLERLARDRANLRAAWQWGLRHGMLAAIDQAVENVENFYDAGAWYQEGETLFSQAVTILRDASALPAEEARRVRGRMLARQGLFCARQGRLEEARYLLHDSLTELPLQVADIDRAYTLHRLGDVISKLGDAAQAQHHHRESLTLARQLNDQVNEMHALNILGLEATKAGDYSAAVDYYQDSLALARRQGDQRMVIRTLNYRGYMLCLAGRAAEAQPLLEEGLALCDKLNDQGLRPYLLASLGQAAYELQMYEEAKNYSLASLAQAQQQGDLILQAHMLARLGDIAHLAGDVKTAWEYLLQSLQPAHTIKAVPRELAALLGLAAVYAQGGNLNRAVELLTIVRHHPSTEHNIRARAERLFTEIAKELRTEELAAAEARAHSQVLHVVVEALLRRESDDLP
jgi:predicted ATPase